MRRTNTEHWAFGALRERLNEKTEMFEPPVEERGNGEPRVLSITRTPDWELGTIFLFDPELKREISDFFYDPLYSEILAVFGNEPFDIPALKDIELTENRTKEASCNAVFIVRDPKRPIGSAARPWWYIRFNIDVKAGAGYFLNTELILSLPFWLQSDWTLDLMIGARDWGTSPSLGVDRDELTVHFSWGKGSWLSFSQREDIERFLEPFRKHVQIAKAIDRFSENPENRFIKSYMLQMITEFYGAQ